MQAPRLYSKRSLFTQYLVTARPEELVNFLNQCALQNVEHVVGCSCRPQSAFHDCWSAHVAPPYSRFGRFAVLKGDNRVNGQIDGMAILAIFRRYVTHDIVLAHFYLGPRLRDRSGDQFSLDRELALALRMAPGPIHSSLEKAVLDVNVGPGLSDMAGKLASACTVAPDRLANSDLTASVRLLLTIKLFRKPLVDVGSCSWIALGVHRLQAESKEQNNIRRTRRRTGNMVIT